MALGELPTVELFAGSKPWAVITASYWGSITAAPGEFAKRDLRIWYDA